MKKKGKTMQKRSQTVRVEVVAPNQQLPVNGSTAIVQATPEQIVQDNTEIALEHARKIMYYREQLRKLIASQINVTEVYAYVTSVTCNKCGGSVKPSNRDDGWYCRKCGGIAKNAATEQIDPYLSGNACRFVLSSAGVSTSEPEMREPRYDRDHGPIIDFECWITGTPKVGPSVRTFGNNPTDDDFFAKRWRYVCKKCGQPTVYTNGGATCAVDGRVETRREAYYLRLEEVDISGVKQKAMTNALNHLVRDLGLMPTRQHFADARVDLSRCKRISFGRGVQDDEGESSPSPAASNAKGEEKARGSARDQRADKNGPVGDSRSAAPPASNSAMPPKANIPKDEGYPLGKGYIDSVEEATTKPKNGKGGGNRYLRIVQSGKALYCFDNRQLTDGSTWFGLIANASKRYAEFKVNASKPQFPAIVAILKLGDLEWLEDGTPVLRRDPPTQQSFIDDERQPGDEDMS